MLTSFSLLSTISSRTLPITARTVLSSTANMSYSALEHGTSNTTSYRLYFANANGLVSPFHDIPLSTGTPHEFNMVVEIPRWTNAKMEICKEEKMNPIKQDIKKGKLRFVDNVFPYNGYIWNYGAFPQTWEDPHHRDPDTECVGDNDPVDVCEIGSRVHPRGAVVRVKALGILALIDEGETDWKVLAIDVNDPISEKLNDLEDIDHHMPGFLNATRQWFKLYKVPQGKPPNKFAFNGQYKNREFAHGIINQTHEQWKKLIGKVSEAGDIRCENVSVAGSPFLITRDDAKEIQADLPSSASGPIDGDTEISLQKWHYVHDE